MARFVLAGNGTLLNRGCQAIEIGTLEILHREFEAVDWISAPFSGPAGGEWGGDEEVPLERLRPPVARPTGFSGVGRRAAWAIVRSVSPAKGWRRFSSALDHMREQFATADAVLSVGGDNYGLDYGPPDMWWAMHRLADSVGTPVVLWGVSVGDLSPLRGYERFAAEQLRRCALILAREQATVDYLRRIRVVDNVRLVGDPAFAMPPALADSVPIEAVVPDGAVGLNLSPLLARYRHETREDWLSVATECVTRLAHTTKSPIVLIPHVMGPAGADDWAFLREVADSANLGKEAVTLLSRDLDARQLKLLISKLRLLVAARTHAAIAGLSSGVPTVSIAYSVKAYGLNQQVFGHSNFVVDCRDLDRLDAVSVALLREEVGVRQRLAEVIPAVREAAFLAGTYLRETILNA